MSSGLVWEEWFGGAMPVRGDVRVHVVLRNGFYTTSGGVPANYYNWYHYGNLGDIIRWALARSREEIEDENV